MSFSDLCKYFTNLEVCTLSPEFAGSSKGQKWKYTEFANAWVKGSTAGGCRNFIQTFASNPQCQFTLEVIIPNSFMYWFEALFVLKYNRSLGKNFLTYQRLHVKVFITNVKLAELTIDKVSSWIIF